MPEEIPGFKPSRHRTLRLSLWPISTDTSAYLRKTRGARVARHETVRIFHEASVKLLER
jgi:hypothetical protein